MTLRPSISKCEGYSSHIARLAVVAAIAALTLSSCGKRAVFPRLSLADSLAINQDNLAYRAKADSFFRLDPGSPFQRDTSIKYHGINWFPINPRYRGKSVLHRYQKQDTVTVMGTKGEQRRELRYGYFELTLPDEHGSPATVRLNVYKFTPYDGQRYELYKNQLNTWFTDATTGKETYGVGRYVEIGEENPDPSFEYTIDLNKAYNPYCAYSPMYSCAIPREEDHLSIALRSGEMKYHPD
jgi:uncharacterized protein (DUF1684 family)